MDEGPSISIYGGVFMLLLIYLTPIVAIIFFVNCVGLAKKIAMGNQNTALIRVGVQ
jgi:hypothetical protein